MRSTNVEQNSARLGSQRVSLRDIAKTRLEGLGRALGMTHGSISGAIDLFDRMSRRWSALEVGASPPWANDITDDGTPFEFSVALSPKQVELRMLLECQSRNVTTTSSWDEGLAMLGELESAGLASLARLRTVADLFRPDPSIGQHFSLWHAGVVREGTAPLVKAYMNPSVRGTCAASDLVTEALERLGLDTAAERLLATGARAGHGLDLRYFALDLQASRAARVKVYAAASESAAQVEDMLRGVENFSPGQARDFLVALTGGEGPFPARPILVCFAFRTGVAQPTATLHVPVRCYVDDDQRAYERVAALLPAESRARLERALAAVAQRPLASGRGLLTYASLTPTPAGVRVTAYLAPELYSVTPSGRAAGPVPGEESSTFPVGERQPDSRDAVPRSRR